MNLKALREERMSAAKEMNDLVRQAAEEKRSLSAEEEAKFDQLDERQADLLKTIERSEKAAEIQKTVESVKENEARAAVNTAISASGNSGAVTANDRKLAIRAWQLAESSVELDSEHREAAAKCGVDLGSRNISLRTLFPKAPKSYSELRDMHRELVTRATTTAQTITTTAGGHLIDTELAAEVEMALLEFGGMREAARVVRTATGGTLNWPLLNDTTNVSTIKTINAAADVEALVFGQASLGAHVYTTGVILVPGELAQDSAFDLNSMIGRAFGERAGRGTNAHFTTGTGSGQPNGVANTSIEGSTGSDVNTLTYNELVDLMHAVDPAYRMDPSCRWMFNDSTLKVIKKLVDSQNRPLWQGGLSGISGDAPDTLLGHRYICNQDMASIPATTAGDGSAAKAVLFGAFNRYIIRDVVDMQLLRLNERYAEKYQVGYVGFHRHDGLTLQASTVTAPIFHFITKST